MLYARGLSRTLQLAAVFAAASASTLPADWLRERDGTCAANWNICSQAGLPANFCCPQGASCNVLAGATTVLCCPTGSDCSTIQTISCNLSLQDPAQNPTAEVKTTELNGKLPTCGNGCCPFGYHCDEKSLDCVQDADQSRKPGESSSSTASPTTTTKPSYPTGTSQTSTTATTTPSNADVKPTAAPSQQTPSPTAARTLNIAAIVGGAVGGVVIILLIIAGIWLIRHKRKNATGGGKRRDSTSTFEKSTISAPIPHADYYAQRLDFLAKAQSSSVATSPTGLSERFSPRSPYSASGFRRDSETIERPRSYHASAEVGGLRNLTGQYTGGAASDPFTSRDDRLKSGGSESINIFADPSTVRSESPDRRQTTWSDLQNHADGLHGYL
ncbi:hypothetical protein GGS21DRAFT_57602 [Xylaria nigripes]|nr:hypothetical protein GGS21DRAFT_57602 [Xylaria nigripes]